MNKLYSWKSIIGISMTIFFRAYTKYGCYILKFTFLEMILQCLETNSYVSKFLFVYKKLLFNLYLFIYEK